MSRIGKSIQDLIIGEKLSITEKIEDKDILLYLGLTNDNNPLYIQHDFASKTEYEKPIVPTIMLTGIVTSAISKYLPGPGSHVYRQEITFPVPAYHYSLITFTFVITDINVHKNEVSIEVEDRNEEKETVLQGKFLVAPPTLQP
ncbi:MaoC/PaaZ C-terminal domain-containing protein [Psychrobacillus sp. FSL K6-4046]|uniref:MaoC/PaaZ C-terminal domain-containing protein n=1 Tax=Psychrobacillus sp. FSL K6-4046 TaxID=2921550 RepID=UPI00315A160D